MKINDKKFNMIDTNTSELFPVNMSQYFGFHQAKSKRSPTQYISRRFCAPSKCNNSKGAQNNFHSIENCFLMSSENLLTLVTAH